MEETAKPAPCLSCDQPVLPMLDVCLACGGRAAYQSVKEAEYGVDVGPVSSQNFRNRVVELLARLFPEIRRERIDQMISEHRVRVCGNLEKDIAEALVAKLGRQETQAAVVMGPPLNESGIVVGFRQPWPYLSLVVGIGLALLVHFWLGIVLGIGGAVGLGFALGKHRQPVLGDGMIPPRPFATWNPVARRAGELLRSLDAQRKPLFAAVTGAVHTTLENLAQDRLLGISAGGDQGTLGQSTIALLEQAVTAAERGDLETLKSCADAAVATRAQISEWTRAAESGANIKAPVLEHAETLSRRVHEMKKVR